MKSTKKKVFFMPIVFFQCLIKHLTNHTDRR